MNPRQLTPDRTVQDEMRIMQRLGFSYVRTNSAGHHVFAHPAHGEKQMSNTPRNPSSWRRRHRESLARLMGLNLFQFERLIAGQPLKRQTRRHRRTEREIRARGRQPASLMIAAVTPAAPVAKACELTPNPGSDDARAAGCICPVYGNRHGRGIEGRDGVFEYVLGCPVHPEERAA